MFINKKIGISDFILSIFLIIFGLSVLTIAPTYSLLLLINPFILFPIALYFIIRFSIKIHKNEIIFSKKEYISIYSVLITSLILFLSMLFLFFYFEIYLNLLTFFGLFIFATLLMLMFGVTASLSLYLIIQIKKGEKKILSNIDNTEEKKLLELNKTNSLSFVFTTFVLTIFSCVLVTFNFTYNETSHLFNIISVLVLFVLGIVFILNSLLEKKYERSRYNTFDIVGGLTASFVLFSGSLGFLINFLVNENKQNFFYFYFVIIVIFSGIYLILSFIYLVKYLKNLKIKNVK